ncbi:MAG: DUF211 domain-containing protein [Candidatus Bathyarchaeia archaeon]
MKELVLDVLKLHSPSLPKLATSLCNLEYVDIVPSSWCSG